MRAAFASRSALLAALVLGGCAGSPAQIADRSAQTGVLVFGETVLGAAKGGAAGALVLAVTVCPAGGAQACASAAGLGAVLGSVIGTGHGFDKGVRRAREAWQLPRTD